MPRTILDARDVMFVVSSRELQRGFQESGKVARLGYGSYSSKALPTKKKGISQSESNNRNSGMRTAPARPSYPDYDTQKPVPPWSEPTPLKGNHDRGGEYR